MGSAAVMNKSRSHINVDPDPQPRSAFADVCDYARQGLPSGVDDARSPNGATRVAALVECEHREP